MGRADYGGGHATDAEDLNGLDNQIAAEATGATRIGVASHSQTSQGEQKSASVAQRGEFNRPKAFAEQEDSVLQRLACRLGNIGDSTENKPNMQQDLEEEDFNDNFIKLCRSRRDTIAHDIRQCQADIEDLSPTGGRRVIARNSMAASEAVSRSPTVSSKEVQPGAAANGCGDESEQDSDDSSDEDMAPDCESIASTAGELVFAL